MPRSPRRLAFLAALSLAAVFAVSAAWIPAKAQVAQVLLHRAWERMRRGEAQARPWPWADTWPVARLRAPGHGIDAIVLAGASGSSLAFGPGHVDGTALPGRCGHCVLSGHRDTHFRFLQHLQPGDALVLEAPDGTVQHFTVRTRGVVHRTDVSVLDAPDTPALTLVTCYPFDAVVPGGPLRFVVRARADFLPGLLRRPRQARRPVAPVLSLAADESGSGTGQSPRYSAMASLTRAMP